MRKFIVLISLLSLSAATSAADRERGFKRGRFHQRGNERSERVNNLSVGNANYGGNGCPQGTMRAVFAPDNLSFTLIFDQFIADVADKQRRRRDVMSCDTLIPIQIPSGMQMEITRVDYRGFVSLPERARARLHSVFNFRGRGGDRDRINLRYEFQGPVMDNYEISSDVMNGGAQTETSPCGGNSQLRILTQMNVISPTHQPASATVDSIDGAAHAIYYMNWRRCN
ncbi:MAG: DUF4360 domain-containing protein [Pseudobdellovibrionaceae bacterium]